MKVLALHGPSGCGKDTIAGLLPDGWRTLKFATPLRLYVYNQYGYDIAKLGDKAYEELYNVLPLILAESKNFHHLYPGLILAWASFKLNVLQERGATGAVFTDLRRPDEQLLISLIGGSCVYVKRERPSRPLQAMDGLLDTSAMATLDNKEGEPGESADWLVRFCEYELCHAEPISKRLAFTMMQKLAGTDEAFFKLLLEH